jgi:4-methylaminobutanoate oxidase (formaldehyde-forming)
LAARIGYVGELGWELHVPVEYAACLYDALAEAGRPFGIADVGYRAIESLRLEKGYVYWGAEVGPEIDPFSAGLGFAVALGKKEMVGREALGAIAATGPTRRLRTFAIDGWAPLHGGEAILHDGRVIGTTTSAGYGRTLGVTVALGYVPAELLAADGFEIEAFMRRHPARLGPRCLYDPKGTRVRG